MEILILGRGKSAISLANVLREEKNNVKFAIEDYESITSDSIYKKDVNIDDYDFFYVSPGVQNNDILLQKLRSAKKNISSEIEYALTKLKDHKIIAITGSNGKTTIATLLYHVLTNKNIKCVVCGNIGDPLVNYINSSIDTYIILEISSFQLELLKKIRPYISVISNITPNHLDRHTFIDYIDIKRKIYKYQTEDDYFITTKNTVKTYRFNPKANMIVCNAHKHNCKYLKGRHNYENINIVISILKILKVNKYSKYIKHFKGVKYRFEYLGKVDNTLIYNDAKSTTIYSTIEALKNVDKRTLLILGGRNKNIDYSIIKDYRVKEIIIYGEEAKITSLNIKKFKDLNEIIIYLKSNIHKYKVILFSPGFTSFDLYNNYVERGEHFERLIKENFNVK